MCDVDGWSIQARIRRARSFYLTRWLWIVFMKCLNHRSNLWMKICLKGKQYHNIAEPSSRKLKPALVRWADTSLHLFLPLYRIKLCWQNAGDKLFVPKVENQNIFEHIWASPAKDLCKEVENLIEEISVDDEKRVLMESASTSIQSPPQRIKPPQLLCKGSITIDISYT